MAHRQNTISHHVQQLNSGKNSTTGLIPRTNNTHLTKSPGKITVLVCIIRLKLEFDAKLVNKILLT